MTLRLYRDDPYLLDFDARVVSRRDHEGQPAVILDQTAFYAASGGQPSDTGSLGGVAVKAVLEAGNDILHVLAGALQADAVHGQVDASRRHDHRQQHHGQHLLSRAFVERTGAKTVSFHLGSDVSSIDLDREVGEPERIAAEERTNEIVWAGRQVRVRTVSRGEALALGLTPPEEAGDSVRLVEAEGFDIQACGGTHPHNTSEVGVIAIVGHERYKGGSRIRFLCGRRVLAAFHAGGQVLERLGALLSSPQALLPEAAQRTMDQLVAAEHRARDLLERALEGEARRLLASASGDPLVVVASYDGWPAEDLRGLAQSLVQLAPCLALLGSRSDKASLVFAQSEGLPHDVPALLREALTQVGGRGGGRGNLAQGAGDGVGALDDALSAARTHARSGRAVE